eukprot:GILJ01014261.1.p1 GENE.GILJ01014261.1~~GILJ01014261.1.p1  ORF type:complete len:452 (-),score=99.03 GILJ01014261.1:124-1383(-)
MEEGSNFNNKTTSKMVAEPRMESTNFLNRLFDPYTDQSCAMMLNRVLNQVKCDPEFYDMTHRSGPVTFVNLRNKKNATVVTVDKGSEIMLGSTSYEVKESAGEGGFATVLCVFEQHTYMDSYPMAIKVLSPMLRTEAIEQRQREHGDTLKFAMDLSLWEFYIASQLRARVADSMLLDDLVVAKNLYLFEDQACMLMPFADQGSIQDLVNLYLKEGEFMDESIVLFYTIQMMRLVEELHSVDIIHGDIKPDNWMVKNEELGEWSDWRSVGWKGKGVKLIDFGRAIDLRILDPQVMFTGNNHTDGFQCVEMLTNRPWKYQIDTFGLCGTVHCMLFGSYMEVQPITDVNGPWKIKLPLKRYWQKDLWEEFFDSLLNLSSEESSVAVLKQLRLKFESQFESNQPKTRSLKNLLIRQNIKLCDR